MALPLHAHPIFNLRKAIIIIDIIGILFCCTSFDYYTGDTLAASAIFLVLSAVLCAIDVVSYATKKLDNPDQNPEWPTRKWIFFDAIMALVLQFMFWCTIGSLTYGYESNITGAYAALADCLCSLLHGWCCWKQVMARCKTMWLAGLVNEPCARCGHVDSNAEPSPSLSLQLSSDQRPNICTYVRPSANFGRANVVTPETPESAMEQGLLMGSDSGSGYGSVDHYEPVVDHPEEVVIGKGKKRKGSG